MLTPRQELAIKHHCRLAVETSHPRFAYQATQTTSIVLTVNSGYE